jgi:hypothetical protein
MSQSGTNVAVTYGQLMSGLSGAANIDLSQAIVRTSGSAAAQTLARLASTVLPLAGGTLSGGLTLAASPSVPLQAATKGYVDQQVSAALPLAGGSLTGTLTLAAAPSRPQDAATKAYADAIGASALPLAGGSLAGTLLLSADPTATLQAATKHYADLKVARSGDTLTGALALAADPVTPLQAATKNYVDARVATSLPLAGGTMLGSLYLASDPTLNAQAATKQYADQRLMRSGDTLTGALSLATDPVLPAQAATKRYADTLFSGAVAVSGASMAGALLLASDPAAPLQASTKQYADLRVSRAGDTLTGALVLAGNPAAPLQAAPKQYVDNQLATAVPVAGGAMTGPLMLAADPAAAKQAATKQYVDGQVATVLPRAGGSLSGTLTLSGDPVSGLQASTKRYVDTQVSAALPLSGGSLSGPLTLAAAPVAPMQAVTKQYSDAQLLNVLSLTGGTLSGSLMLAGPPTVPLQAATKSYVDANPGALGVINIKLPPYNAKIDGTTDDTAAFKAAYLAAPAGSAIYVPNGTTVMQTAGNWGIALTKYVKWIVDGTLLPDGTPLASAIPVGNGPANATLPGLVVGNTSVSASISRAGSQPADFAVNHSSYIVSHTGGVAGTVATNVRADTIVYNSPNNYIWGGLDRLIWAGTQTPVASSPAQHVSRYIQAVRNGPAFNASGTYLPQPQVWAACLEYHDTSGQPSSVTNASLTVEMDWFGNGADDADCRAIQSLVIGQHSQSGPPVEVGTIIGAYLGGGSSGSAKTVFKVGLPFSNAVLDTTIARSINNAPIIKMTAGQAIAFDTSNSNRLFFDNPTGTLRWQQGPLSFAVGKGISVGWMNVFGGPGSIPAYIAGNMLFLVGSSPYTLTLPPASSVAAGTGFTFSVVGSAAVTIAPAGADIIQTGLVVLHTNDRYHIVSDGSSNWNELFWTNAISPRFLGPIVLQSYTVGNLPSGVAAGAKAFASNARKPNEGSGSGTGVEVFFDGQRWISSCSGSAVAA